jgi:hypothetical protein
MYLGFVGKGFVLINLSSLIGVLIGSFIIGAHIEKYNKIAFALYILPTLVFWTFILFALYQGHIMDYTFFSRIHIVPYVMILLSVALSIWCFNIGLESQDGFDRPKSILNIKWYNWLWILPFLLPQMISILALALSILISTWFVSGGNEYDGFLIDLIFNFNDYIVFFIVSAIIYGLFYLIIFIVSLLTTDDDMKFKWLIILGIVILLDAVYIFFIGLPLLNLNYIL